MSDPRTGCPLSVSCNCPDYRNPRVCALVRADRHCLHHPGRGRRERIMVGFGPIRPDFQPTVLRNPEIHLSKGQSHFAMRYDKGWRELD